MALERARAALGVAEREPEHWKRLLLVAAAVAAALEPDPAYVVGGMVVESYTQGSYMTRDIDFASALLREQIAPRIEPLGFERLPSGSWIHPRLRVVLDFPGRLDPEEMSRLVTVDLGGGVSIRILSLEDILLDRLQAAVHWGDLASEEWVRHMLAAHADRIDWRLLATMAQAAGCADLLARLKAEARPGAAPEVH